MGRRGVDDCLLIPNGNGVAGSATANQRSCLAPLLKRINHALAMHLEYAVLHHLCLHHVSRYVTVFYQMRKANVCGDNPALQ